MGLMFSVWLSLPVSPCALGAFLVGLTQEWNYRLLGNMPLLLFPRLPYCSPHSVPGHWFPNQPHRWDPQGLVHTGVPGLPGPEPVLLGDTQGVESYFIKSLGASWTCIRAVPPGSAVFSLGDFGPVAGSL